MKKKKKKKEGGREGGRKGGRQVGILGFLLCLSQDYPTIIKEHIS